MLQIVSKNIELNDATREYAEKRFADIEKFLRKEVTGMQVELSRTTNHHKQGDVFRAEISLSSGGRDYYAFSEKESLYAAIDDVREEIVREIKRTQNRAHDLFIRGARSVKKMLKGVSKRNPFTSKTEE